MAVPPLDGVLEWRLEMRRPPSRKRLPDSPSMAAETKPGAASADDESATASSNSCGMWEPSSWSKRRITTRIFGLISAAASAVLRFARSSSPVSTIDAGVLDVGGAQGLGESVVADDQADTMVGQPLLGVRGRPDGHDLLVAEAQLLDRPEPQVVDAADHRMAVGWLGAGRRHGGQSMRRARAPDGAMRDPRGIIPALGP